MRKKTLLAIFLSLILSILTLTALTSCSSINKKMEFAFITDTHVYANANLTAENYAFYEAEDKMIHLSNAILDTVVDELIDKKYKYVFFGGDMTENGDKASHEATVAALNRLEQKKIKVFVIDGNHDIAHSADQLETRVSQAQFKELYNNFGYSEAIATYDGTLSYVADVDKNYRLIAVDNMAYYIDGENDKADFDTGHAAWVEEQAKKCVTDGKTPILIGHQTLLNHYPHVTDGILSRSYYNLCKKLVTSLADSGANYFFGGHFHIQDVTSFTTENGSTFYDVETASTAYDPACYRKVTFTKKEVEIETKYIQKVDTKYVSQFASENLKKEITDNFRDYCYKHAAANIELVISTLGKSNGILGSMNFDGDIKKLTDIILPKVVDKLLNLPLYIDGENNNTSLERLLQANGITLPKTNFNTLANMAPYIVSVLSHGDANVVGCDEFEVMKYAILSAFYFINECSDEIATALPDFPKININCEKLFKEGIVESYDSNFIPFILKLVNDLTDNTLVNNILASINTDYSELASFKSALNIFLGMDVSPVLNCFDGKNLKLSQLVDALFINLAPDFATDEAPADNNLKIER